MDTSGFYKRSAEKGLEWAPNYVLFPDGRSLKKEGIEKFPSNPEEGWYWFESLEDALRSIIDHSVTDLQLDFAMNELGWYDKVEAQVEKYEGFETRHARKKREIYHRYNPTTLRVGRAVGMTDDDFDKIFWFAGRKDIEKEELK